MSLAGSSIVHPTRTLAQDGDRKLRVLGGSQYFELPAVVDFFESNGIDLEVTPIATPDDVPLFLNAGGVGLYDLAVTNHGLIETMATAGLLGPIQPEEIVATIQLFPEFQRPTWAVVDEEQYAVPVLWGSLATALVADADLEPPAILLDLFEERFKGGVIMSDDVLGHFWTWSRALDVPDPARMTIDQLNATTELLILLKFDQARSFESSVYDGMKKMAGGRGLVSSVGWQTASLIPGPGERSLLAVQPDPGAASFCDVLCIPSEAPSRDLAVAVIDFMLAPEPQAQLVNALNWATVTPAAVDLIKPELRSLFDYNDLNSVFARSPMFGYPPRSANDEGVATYLDWIVSWDRIKTAKK